MANPNCKACGGTGLVPAGYSSIALPNETCLDCAELEPVPVHMEPPFTPADNELEEQFWKQYEEEWDNGGDKS